MLKYKFIPHTADIQFQAYGKSLEDVFKNSALALKEIICEKKVKSNVKKEIKINGKDLIELLHNFLEEILYLFETENFLLSKVSEIKIDEKKLKLEVELFGDNANNYEIKEQIKAVTYHDMFVKREKEKWISQIVVDV